jgi:hypothetical protein
LQQWSARARQPLEGIARRVLQARGNKTQNQMSRLLRFGREVPVADVAVSDSAWHFFLLVTGLVTAARGAWNASIVAEYFQFVGR